MSAVSWIAGAGALGVGAYLWREQRERERADHNKVMGTLLGLVEQPHHGDANTSAVPSHATAGTVVPASLPATLPGRWVWPVGAWNGRAPVVSSGFGLRPNGPHKGVDVMFRRAASDTFAPGTPNGSKLFVMPDNMPALAAHDGVMWSALQTPRGFAVVIDHTPLPIATFYTHLDRLFVKPTAHASTKEHVRAGQPIGNIGYDLKDPARLRHLHFEVWPGGPNHPGDAIDPAPFMSAWEVIGATERSLLVARNAALVYRPLGSPGEAYPDWVRDLKGKSGVYVIREIDDDGNADTVYVGSSVANLYETLTRHLQTWRRWNRVWKGQYGHDHDPGVTYPRDRVEVAVRLTRPSDALDEEARLIRRLRPRDNINLQPIEEVPF
jgi:hypothetical protein